MQPDLETRRHQQSNQHQDGDLSDLVGELRVLLPGTQTLTAFLIILPFTGGFNQIRGEEKAVYVVTFLCSLTALIFFTAPAAQHRLQRPLKDREAFKDRATRLIIIGLVPLSIALVLVSQLVMSTVIGAGWIPWLISGILAMLIAALWWIYPVRTRDQGRQ